MEIIIKTKNLELTDSLESFINKKVGLLKKFISVLKEKTPEKGKTLAQVLVEVEKVTKHHKKGDVFKAEIIVFLPGKKLIAESTGSNLLRTVIEAKDEMEREIKKYKFKTTDVARRKQRKSKDKNVF